MPRIPRPVLDCVVYLYPTEQDARDGTNFGGSGFLLSWPIEGTNRALVYVVTNWHVACQGSPLVRINTTDGGSDISAFDGVGWQFLPKYDVAVHAIALNRELHQYSFIPVNGLISQEKVAEQRIGPGDDVFMVGRFIDHDGGKANKPAVRFGNISINPTPITQPNDSVAASYCVDMHSRTGYSGSPVFVYRTPGFDLDEQLVAGSDPKLLLAGVNLFMLLGIHFAQFPELWEVTEQGRLIREGVSEPLLTDGKYIRGLRGMTCVLPAWAIMEVLNMPSIKAHRAEVEAIARANAAKETSAPIGEASTLPASGENPTHREDFNRLLGAAARKREQED